MLLYRSSSASYSHTHSDRKGGFATRTAHPLPAPAIILRHLPNLQREAVETLSGHVVDLWSLSSCSPLRTRSPAWHKYYLFAYCQSILILRRLLARSPIQFWHVRSNSPASAPGSGRLSYLLHSGIPYTCVIYIHVKSFPFLLYPLLSPLLGTDTYLPIADLGDI